MLSKTKEKRIAAFKVMVPGGEVRRMSREVHTAYEHVVIGTS